VLAVGLLLATLASVALARRMVAPVRRLQEGAARVGKGELDHRIDIRTGDELQALAEEFNHTTARLQDSQNTLEQKVDEGSKELQCIKTTLLASMQGYAPQVAVEFGRKVLYSADRPTFSELETHVKGSGK